jgi:hypothetical protein
LKSIAISARSAALESRPCMAIAHVIAVRQGDIDIFAILIAVFFE